MTTQPSPSIHVKIAAHLLEMGHRTEAAQILELLAVNPPAANPDEVVLCATSTSAVKIDPILGSHMHEWHDGHDDPVYKVGTLVKNEQPVEKTLLEAAIGSLEMVRACGGLSGDDARDLDELVARLDAFLFGRR